jgi:hypothetical protein
MHKHDIQEDLRTVEAYSHSTLPPITLPEKCGGIEALRQGSENNVCYRKEHYHANL